jgi:glyceraldehyde 3-phosphate dehydrogenase
MVRVAINGYGRIGRIAHRVIAQWHSDEIDIVAINAGSSTDLKGWMYLLKYDSVYGLLPSDITVKPSTDETNKAFLGHLVIGGKEIPVYSQKDPTLLPWKDLNVDVVIESTGHFTTAEKLQTHITAGAKSVILSAPAKGEGVGTYVVSINDTEYHGEKLINNASCTTNCITPVAKIIHEKFGIDKAMMTTIHAYTSDQKLHDGGHKDYRRARAAAQNIVPTSTGASVAAGEAFPPLKGIFGGLSIRVPVPVGSLADFTFVLKKPVTVEEVNQALTQEAENPVYKGIMAVSNDPLVSSDIIGNSHSSIVDLSLTQVVGGNMLKIIAWYDNEYGYANRLIEQTIMVGQKSAAGVPPPAPTTVEQPMPVQPILPPVQQEQAPIQQVQAELQQSQVSQVPPAMPGQLPNPAESTGLGLSWEPNPPAAPSNPAQPGVPPESNPNGSGSTGGSQAI